MCTANNNNNNNARVALNSSALRQELSDVTKAHLTVNVTSLSATRRRKESAPDPRASSRVMGAFGVALVALVCGLMVGFDTTHLWKMTHHAPPPRLGS